MFIYNIYNYYFNCSFLNSIFPCSNVEIVILTKYRDLKAKLQKEYIIFPLVASSLRRIFDSLEARVDCLGTPSAIHARFRAKFAGENRSR